jgi:hypothetical protein
VRPAAEGLAGLRSRLRSFLADPLQDHRCPEGYKKQRDYETQDAASQVAEIVQKENDPQADQKNSHKHRYPLSFLEVTISRRKRKDILWKPA